MSGTGLTRQMGLLGLVSTGVCSMLGASIYVVPFMIQRNVPGIGPFVISAFLFAALPALLAAFAYAVLASAMPRAGGSYIYASRCLSPYLGFAASFSQWFGLSIVIGVIAYVIVPFLRDIALAMEWHDAAAVLNNGTTRIFISMAFLWTFVLINILGIKVYEKIVVPLMIIMFALGAVVIIAGFTYTQDNFISAATAAGKIVSVNSESNFSWGIFLGASSLLFSSFIGFDSIAQAGGEAKYPARSLPVAIGITISIVSLFYFLFTAAVYNAVPWSFVASEAVNQDITAPGLMRYLLPAAWTAAIVAGAAIALINDLPAMLLSVSRLMFAWAEDGIFPKKIASVHQVHKTPFIALIVSGFIATIGILGSHFAGDFFLGIDIMVTSMQFNFLLMCITLIALPTKNPELEKRIKVFKSRRLQLGLAWSGALLLSGFLNIHIWKDLSSPTSNWYFHSTYIWLIVMSIGTMIYFREIRRLKKSGKDINELFSNLPAE